MKIFPIVLGKRFGTSTSRKVWILAICFCALFAVLLLGTGGQDTAREEAHSWPPSTTTNVDGAKQSLGSTEVGVAPDMPARTTALPAHVNTMPALAAYQSGVELRRFILDAIRDPSNGAALYALRALGECKALDLMTDVNLQVQPDFGNAEAQQAMVFKVAAFDYVKRRCSGLLGPERDDLEEALVKSASNVAEPVFTAINSFSEAARFSDVERRRAALAAVFATADPAVFDSLGLRIGLYSGGADLGPQFRFQGETYPLRSDADVAAAVNLIPCGLGLRCDEKEGQIGLHCVDGGACHASRFDELSNGIFKNEPARYARVIGLYERMVTSIKAGAVDDFLK